MIAAGPLLLAGALLVAATVTARSTERLREASGAAGADTATPLPELPSRATKMALGALAGLVLMGPAGALLAPPVIVLWRRAARLRNARATRGRADEQLADAVGALSSAVRSGMSVPQALAYTAGEAEPPLQELLAVLVADIEVGVPLHDAVDAWAARVGTEDARLLASVLELHRITGGDLTAVLDQVGSTIRERVAAAAEVRALTAQARLSGLILGLLPIAFFGFLWLTSRKDMQAALGTPAGAASVALGLIMEGTAFLWIRRLLEIG